MKKILLALLFLFTLCSCSKQGSDMITYLNNNDVAVYLYNEMVEEDFGMDNFTRINTLDSIELTHTYSCIIVNVESKRSLLTKDVVDSFYDLLLMDNKVMIVFYEGENYNFFKNTSFANEKDYYDNVAQICSYNNFNNEIQESYSDTNLKSYHSCLIHLEAKIKEYRGSL
ncbi:MAG: hypothetical protein K2N64_03755 [Anaeroplasmataceae bacterium]|nr:hypothetical protein [Anaeroplasmataceae bacterium]